MKYAFAAEYKAYYVPDGAWVPNWVDWGVEETEEAAWERIHENEGFNYEYIGYRVERMDNPTLKDAFELTQHLYPATPYDGPDGEERYRREFGYED